VRVIKEAYKNVASPIPDYRDPINIKGPNRDILKLRWREAEVWGINTSRKAYRFTQLPINYRNYLARAYL
jgi:hypothetical protein